MPTTIMITGATSGIGKACAVRFAAKGKRLIITGRRDDRLQELAETLRKEHNAEVLTVAFDISKRESVESAMASLDRNWKNIDILINNAGLASGLSSIQDGNIDDWEVMIDTNVKGLLYITRAVSPGMIAQRKGHIINIGSIAGKQVYAKGNVYCATKYAVNALTQAMRIDMLEQGIKVSQICPGAVETEFSEVRFKGDKNAAANVYQGFIPLKAEDIAEAVFWVAGLPAHVNVNDLVIMPVAQASPGYLYKTSL
jgi:NADP-dependent 3-hydroxy acid dehydrogenase YdfG